MVLKLPDSKPSLNRSGLLVAGGMGVINSFLSILFIAESGDSHSIAGDSFTLIIWLIILIFAFSDLHNTVYRAYGIIIALLGVGVILLLGLLILSNLDIITIYVTSQDYFMYLSICLLTLGSALFVMGLFYSSLRKHEDRHMKLYSLIVISFLLVGLYGVISGYYILTSQLSFPEFGYLSSAIFSFFLAIKIVPLTLALIADADVLLIQES